MSPPRRARPHESTKETTRRTKRTTSVPSAGDGWRHRWWALEDQQPREPRSRHTGCLPCTQEPPWMTKARRRRQRVKLPQRPSPRATHAPSRHGTSTRQESQDRAHRPRQQEPEPREEERRDRRHRPHRDQRTKPSNCQPSPQDSRPNPTKSQSPRDSFRTQRPHHTQPPRPHRDARP